MLAKRAMEAMRYFGIMRTKGLLATPSWGVIIDGRFAGSNQLEYSDGELLRGEAHFLECGIGVGGAVFPDGEGSRPP